LHESKTTAEVHDYLDERTGVLAAMLAKRASDNTTTSPTRAGSRLLQAPARTSNRLRNEKTQSRNLKVLNLMYPWGMREMGIQEARPVLGDLVRDAQRHGIETRLTRNGRPAARIARLTDTDGSAAECEKILARYAGDPGIILTDPEREAISVVRAVLARVTDEGRDARLHSGHPQRVPYHRHAAA
jgi:antitoxin (DNA-binding transcriptional repressor) of toxin-antitoxin stability system